MLNFTTVENLRWVNAEHTRFDCDVFFVQLNEVVPFACDMNDKYSHSQEIWTKGLSGEFGPIAEYVDPHIPTQPQPNTQGSQTI